MRRDNTKQLNDAILLSIKPPPSRLQRKKYVTSWNPLLQPMSVKEFHSLGLYPQHMHLINRKLLEIKQKIKLSFLKEQLISW